MSCYYTLVVLINVTAVCQTSVFSFPPAGFLGTVNDFFVKYGLDPVTNLTEISASTFVAMYEIILGDRLAGKVSLLYSQLYQLNFPLIFRAILCGTA